MTEMERLLNGIRTGVWLIVILLALILMTGCSAPEPSRQQMQDEYDAYRLCMQTAGRTRCSMTPQDFVRYYELKRILEQSNDGQGDTNDS